MLTETAALSDLNSADTGVSSSVSPVDRAIALARNQPLSLQSDTGYWVFEL